MPYESPGRRYDATATKQVNHGDPSVELGHGGIAAKSAQTPPMAPSVANALLAQQIAVGEEFTIMLDGIHEVSTTLLPVGAVAGSQLYIEADDNSLVLAAEATTGGVLNAGFTKFGVIDSIDTALGEALVNLTQRSSF